MSLAINLQSIKCLNETSEASASDEVYVLVTTALFRTPLPGVPASVAEHNVIHYGIFEDMDDDDPNPVTVSGPAFWGLDGNPAPIGEPDDVAVIVSLMEHDNGSPQQYRELVDVKASQSLLSSAANPSTARRAALLVDDVNNVLNAIDVPIPFAFDDDHLGTRLLPLDSSDLLKGGMKEKRMVISGDGGEYELVFRIRYRGWEHSVPGLADVVHVLPGTSPTSWYTPKDNVQHIAYVGTDQQIHEPFFRLDP
ncbi:hypothetical protein [Nonomuraea sp. B19D2]|uniref:hypothetical protein n=1 Tax=Nonomuraea sp. B19D2 TaxID=3159561 RepID=UPI0032DB8E3E